MERLSTENKAFVLETLLLFGICFCIMQQKPNVVSILFHVTFFLLVFIFVLQLWMTPKLKGLHILVLVTILLSFIHVSIQAEKISFSYYNKLIMFSCTLMMLPITDGLQVQKKLVDWVLGVNVAIALLYVVMYWGFKVRTHIDVYLAMNFSNPNAAGLFMCHSLLYCALAFYRYRHWFVRAMLVALFLALFWLMRETGTRSAYLALISFAGLTAFSVLLKKEVRISPQISFILVLTPFIFAIVYLALSKGDFLDKWFSSFSARGKSLDSRVGVWEYALGYYRLFPVIGAYNDISGGTGMSQLHNTHIDVLASYGTVPFALFVLCMHVGVLRILDMARSDFGRMCMYAFYATLLLGSFEAALVAGGTGLYILSFGFLVLAKYNERDYVEGIV